MLVLSLMPYRFATRARKSADDYSKHYRTEFLSLAGAGRAGAWDRAGDWWEHDVRIRQVRLADIRTSPSVLSRVANTVMVYVPAFVRMLRLVLSSDAHIVHVANPVISWMGVVHKRRHGSRLLLDLPERVGQVNTLGSLAAWFSKVEPWLLRRLAAKVDVAMVVVPGEIRRARELGFREVYLVRNAPLDAWRAPFTPPTDGRDGVVLACIGSIFEGRGYEMLLRAMATARGLGYDVRLRIAGDGREEYVATLHKLTAELGLRGVVEWVGRIDSAFVSQAYLSAHAGLVLYESNDPGNDGLSNKLMECVATGRPVLAGDLPENRAFVSEMGVGWLSEMSASSLASQIGRIAESGDLVELAAHCRHLGDTQLTWDREFEPVVQAISSQRGCI